MALLTPCIGALDDPCGIPAPPGGCEKHRAQLERAHHNSQYDDPRYRAFRAELLAEHRAKHGDWCPGDGDEHPAHASTDLTLDHPHSLATGGALFDRRNARVLCRTRNSQLGGRRSSSSSSEPIPDSAQSALERPGGPMDSITLALRSPR